MTAVLDLDLDSVCDLELELDIFLVFDVDLDRSLAINRCVVDVLTRAVRHNLVYPVTRQAPVLLERQNKKLVVNSET